MPNKMLIDASHPEETRVVVTRGNRIEEFDFESEDKKQLRGNIYLARVTRVEPSLQAAFVEYGGNRHGFLAFSEIHPDYYQIPVADRQALLQAEAEDAQADDEDEEEEKTRSRNNRRRRNGRGRDRNGDAQASNADNGNSENGDEAASSENGSTDEIAAQDSVNSDAHQGDQGQTVFAAESDTQYAPDATTSEAAASEEEQAAATAHGAEDSAHSDATSDASSDESEDSKPSGSSMPAIIEGDVISEAVSSSSDQDQSSESERTAQDQNDDSDSDDDHEDDQGNGDDDEIEMVGAGDALDDAQPRRRTPRRQYKIQEVIKRRQILLIQVVKEERGNKGAALTTYLSLAGRYSVLMPNTARGGGISRKITNVQDRKRLKEIVKELEVPQGMGVILRTAGESRTKPEIKRDYEYLMRMWESVRTRTLSSTAPALVYEEGSLIKRSVRDLYNKDIEEILVSGEEGYREAKDFMRLLMPSHAKVVQPFRDTMPIFARNGIEAQLDRMLQPQVNLKSGGYIVINQTEALVAVDVNSGRSTKEHSIEDTALQTNLEAAEEVSRQLRLRDLAGLIVIDFIDMEENRNNRAVEKRLKDFLKNDRARIQVGRISHFGLLEMSRQRMRTSVLESTTQICSHCGGSGLVRSDFSVALHVIRTIEEYLLKDNRHHITVRTNSATALYVLNHKRSTLVDLEKRFGVIITIEVDENLGAQHCAIIKGGAVENPIIITAPVFAPIEEDEDDVDLVFDDEEAESESSVVEVAQVDEDEEQSPSSNDEPRRRRRRRRGGRDKERNAHAADNSSNDGQAVEASVDADGETGDDQNIDASSQNAAQVEGEGRKRRRGKRGGRRNRRDESHVTEASGDAIAAEISSSEENSQPEISHPTADNDAGSEQAAAASEMPVVAPEIVAAPVAEAVVEPVVAPAEAVTEPVVAEATEILGEAEAAKPVEAAEAEADKPVRKPRTRRPRAKADAETAETIAETAVAAAEEAAPVAADESGEDVEVAPVRKTRARATRVTTTTRTPRATKASIAKEKAAASEAAAAQETPAAAPIAETQVAPKVEAPVAEQAPSEPVKAAAPDVATPAAEPAKIEAAEPTAPTEAPAEEKQERNTRRRQTDSEQASAEPIVTSSAPAASEDKPADDAAAPKGGWWQKRGFL